MFKKIGIFVKENSSKGVDENALDSMLSLFMNKNIKLEFEVSFSFKTYTTVFVKPFHFGSP